jgi:FixJ family two-component response regulator
MTNISTIAVIDDDDSIRQSVRQLLRAAEFQALTFASAEEYLTHGDGAGVDCLIVDVNLPGMSGVALVQTLAASGSKTPAILITARDDPATLDLIGRAGPIPHLRKPFNEKQLFAAMSQILSKE